MAKSAIKGKIIALIPDVGLIYYPFAVVVQYFFNLCSRYIMDGIKSRFDIGNSKLAKVEEEKINKLDSQISEATAAIISEYIGLIDNEGHKIRQKDVAHVLGISLPSLKNYIAHRQVALPISILSRIAVSTGQPLQAIFGKLLRYLPKSKTIKTNEVAVTDSTLTSDQRKTFERHLSKESELFGNEFSWAMEIANTLLKSDDKLKAEIELKILQSIKDRDKKFTSENMKKRAIKLFEYLLP